MLHKLESISKIIKLVLYSAYIQDESQPISALLVCVPEAGKTDEIKQASLLPGILYPTDMTAFGILTTYGQDLMNRVIRHILIPDLITPLSKRWETSASFISFLNQLCEEGIVEVRTFALSQKFQQPVKCGIIACITPKQLQDRRHRWMSMGFMSRMLPISWSYSNPVQVEIFDFICGRKYRDGKLWEYKFPSADVKVELPIALAKELVPYTFTFAQTQATYGFRYQKHLQRLAMASAIVNGREVVNKSDIDDIKDLIRFLNINETAI